MSAGIYDLLIEQGATFTRTMQYKDSTGTAINLTGMTLNAQIRRSYSDPTITQSFTIVIANQTVPATVGQFSISLTSAQTASIPVNPAVDFQNNTTNYTWDIFLNTGSEVRRLIQGAVFVSPEVTS